MSVVQGGPRADARTHPRTMGMRVGMGMGMGRVHKLKLASLQVQPGSFFVGRRAQEKQATCSVAVFVSFPFSCAR